MRRSAAIGPCWLPLIAALSIWPLAHAAYGEPLGPLSGGTAACIRDPRCHRMFVVAHRAKGFGAPENSREAVMRCVEAGVPLVKIDLRRSREGELFVLHDATLDRTTTARGRIEVAGPGQLARARLENGETVPRFEEIYRLARGRMMLVLGFKTDVSNVVGQMADWIQAHGSFDDVIFLVNNGEQVEAAAQAKKRHPTMLVMVRLLDTRITLEGTRAVFGGRLPEILHTDPARGTKVSSLRALGVKVYASALRAESYIQPFKYFLSGSILRSAPDFVQTDEPTAVLRRLAN